jgi:hypothetical protein
MSRAGVPALAGPEPGATDASAPDHEDMTV